MNDQPMLSAVAPSEQGAAGARCSLAKGSAGLASDDPRRIAAIAFAPAGWLAMRESEAVQRLCAQYREQNPR